MSPSLASQLQSRNMLAGLMSLHMAHAMEWLGCEASRRDLWRAVRPDWLRSGEQARGAPCAMCCCCWPQDAGSPVDNSKRMQVSQGARHLRSPASHESCKGARGATLSTPQHGQARCVLGCAGGAGALHDARAQGAEGQAAQRGGPTCAATLTRVGHKSLGCEGSCGPSEADCTLSGLL
jgi:hypothetical protein